MKKITSVYRLTVSGNSWNDHNRMVFLTQLGESVGGEVRAGDICTLVAAMIKIRPAISLT